MLAVKVNFTTCRKVEIEYLIHPCAPIPVILQCKCPILYMLKNSCQGGVEISERLRAQVSLGASLDAGEVTLRRQSSFTTLAQQSLYNILFLIKMGGKHKAIRLGT